MKNAPIVVITGASAGIGRATAQAFGKRGYRVALLARGEAGLDGAARDVREAGGEALPIPVDVADHAWMASAGDQVAATWGPVDIWVNAAFTSVFGPFTDISPQEYRRVTEVTYLGFVHGTQIALRHMRQQDRGTIVQVGSALAYRGVPLQSAYCGAKHAIQGFTESVRCELRHERSRIRVTMVQLPAVNTPQFSWVRSRLPAHPQPMPPIYQPEVAAEAVLAAADRPQRREYWAGGSTVGTLLANAVFPGILERYLARSGYDSQQNTRVSDPHRSENLWAPADAERDYGAHGVFDAVSRDRCRQLWFSWHHTALACGAIVLGAIGFRRLFRKRA